MRINHRLIGISALAIGLVLISVSAVVIFIAVGGPWLGLGEEEQFVFFKAWGISRTDTLMRGGQILLLGAVACAINLLYWYEKLGARVNEILSEEPRTPSGPLVKALAVAAVKTGPMVARAWEFLNRDWSVVAMLMPFALFILGFYLFAFPKAVWIVPDSLSYLGFNFNRTLAYPLFVRLIALVADDPGSIIAIQLVFGLGTILFFAEAFQRLFRNFLVSLPVGVLLMFNWPMLEHAFALLTEYPFFGLVCLQFGVAVIAFVTPSPRQLVSLAIITALALALRPVALFMLIVIPFLIVVHPRRWRSVIGYLVVPLVVLGLAQAGVNKAVFDYFGLSRFSGYPMAANTLFMLKEDTPSTHPELVKKLYELAKPYQEKYLAVQTDEGKTRYNIRVNGTLIHRVTRVVRSYGEAEGIVTYTNTKRHAEFVRFINELSPLNLKLGGLRTKEIPYWFWLDALLTDLAIKTVLHNPSGWLGLLWPNLHYAWNTVIPSYPSPEKGFAMRPTLRLDREDFGLNSPSPDAEIADVAVFNPRMFNRVANTLNMLDRLVPISWTVLFAAIGVMALLVVRVCLDRRVSPEIAVLAYLAASLFAYHFEVSVASIPLPRLISPIIPAAMTLLFSPVLLLFHLVFRTWFSRRTESPPATATNSE